MPACAYIILEGASWALNGCDVPGVFPLKVVTSGWYLEGHRANPKLKINRCQLPLAPGFSVTIHSTQGSEFDPLLVDVCISTNTSNQMCYVALSRAKTRHGVHILRPFPASTFQGRPPLGPEVLLKKLRKEHIS